MDSVIDRIKSAYKTRDFELIEKTMREEKAAAAAKGEAGYQDFIVASNELGAFLKGASRYNESLECFEEVLATLDKLGVPKPSHVYIIALINKAGTYRNMGNKEAALDTYKQVKAILEGTGQTMTMDYATLLNNLSMVQYDMGDYHGCIASGQEAVGIVQEIGTKDTEIAITYINIANAYININDIPRAKFFARKAKEMYEELGFSRGHYSAALNTIASIDCIEGNYDDALVSFEAAIKQTEADFGKNHDYAEGLINIARVYEAKGDSETAAEYMQRAKELLSELSLSGAPE